jgi:oligopeptide/dipeptide ABC transporter ATP-binding protein
MNDSQPVVLKVEHLVKEFPIRGSRELVHAVNDVSFQVQAGETLSLVGESGSGKTTVGRCILKLIEPTSGQITIGDINTTRLSQKEFRPYRPRVQMVFQEPYGSLNPRMTIRQIVEENLILQGKLDRQQRQARLLELLHMMQLHPKVLEDYPHELTSGEQQRVAIARAISTNPELIVLDEPTSDLDITVRAEIIRLLRDLQRELNIAYLFISHDLSAVKEISHRVAIMYLGQIVEVAPNPEVFDLQLHPYAQALLASVLFPDPDAQYASVSLKGEIPSPVNLPHGCYLHPRCPFAESICSAEQPILRPISSDRLTACHFGERFLATANAIGNSRTEKSSNNGKLPAAV